jgi:hypothetical protein
VASQASALSRDDDYLSVIEVYSPLQEDLPYFIYTKSCNPLILPCYLVLRTTAKSRSGLGNFVTLIARNAIALAALRDLPIPAAQTRVSSLRAETVQLSSLQSASELYRLSDRHWSAKCSANVCGQRDVEEWCLLGCYAVWLL